MLRYAIFLLLSILLVITIVDWIIFFGRINENSDSFVLIDITSKRTTYLGLVLFFTRERDLVFKYFSHVVSNHVSNTSELNNFENSIRYVILT